MPRNYVALADRLTAFLRTELGVNDRVLKSIKPRGFTLESDGTYLGINAGLAQSVLRERFANAKVRSVDVSEQP